VQNIVYHCVFVSRDVVFEEGLPHQTLASVGEQIPVFGMDLDIVPSENLPINTGPDLAINDDHHKPDITNHNPVDHGNQPNIVIPAELRRSTWTIQPSKAIVQSMEYKECEHTERGKGQEWALYNNRHPKVNIVIDGSNDHDNTLTCLNETKASYNISQSYHHAMAINPDRWIIPMKVEMETLKVKQTHMGSRQSSTWSEYHGLNVDI
jgi:hypothetical protein